MSEMQALTDSVESLSKQADGWNRWMLWGLVAVVVAALWVWITTRMVTYVSKKKETAQAELTREKDRQLALELSQKDSLISEAQKDAARLNKLAEDEKLSRVKLEKQLAPREISGQDELIQFLKPFAPKFEGRKITVSSYSADAEGIVFSLRVNNILAAAGFDIEQHMGRNVPIGLPIMGVKVSGPVADSDFVRILGSELQRRSAKEASDVWFTWDDSFIKVEVAVGVKPIAGLLAN